MLGRANDILRGFEPDPDDRPDDWTYEFMRTERNLVGRVANRFSTYSNLEMEHMIVTIRQHLPAGTVFDWEYLVAIEETVAIFAIGDIARVLSLCDHVFGVAFEAFVCAKI